MVLRFCLYSILKNLRFADSFMVLFLLHLELSYAAIGAMLGYQHMVTASLEVPLGVVADRVGRRTSLIASFTCYSAAFVLFALVDRAHVPTLYLALTTFGLGEALRTGSHKAIMLDYLDGRGESHRATWLIGKTRSFSKFSAAAATLGGAGLLYVSHAYSLLFWLSALSSLGGALVVLGYPRALEGESTRARDARRAVAVPFMTRVRALFGEPGSVRLMLQSTLFESQIKLILKYYLQPMLKQALAAFGLVVLGAGALYIGVIEAVREALGGVAALSSERAERAVGSTRRALVLAYLLALLGAAGIAASAAANALVPAVILLVGMTALQNLRRPIFVKAFNEVLDKPQRATGLSVESLSRSVCVAVMLPLTGLLADAFGLFAAFAAIALMLSPGLFLTPRHLDAGPPERAPGR